MRALIKNINIKDNETILLLISLCVTIFWAATQKIGYNGDSTTYILLSEYLAGKIPFGNFAFFRTIGYPCLMLLAAVPYLYSLKGLLLLQFAMAIYIPILFYRSLILLTKNPRFSLIASLVLISSLLPFLYCKIIMPDQFFIFVLFTVAYRLTTYYGYQTKKELYLLIASLILLTLIRPSANLFFIIVFVYCMLFFRKHIKIWLTSLVIFFSVMAVISAIVSLKSNPFITGSMREVIPKTLFYHIYLKNGFQPGHDSKYTASLKPLITQFSANYINAWADRTPQYLFNPYRNNVNQFVDKIFEKPNLYYFNYAIYALESALALGYPLPEGDTRDFNRFLIQLDKEAILNNPRYLISYIKTYLLGSGSSFAGQQLFYHSYVPLPSLSDNGGTNISVFKPTLGPANKQLLELLTTFLYAFPEHWNTREPKDIFANFKDNPQAFIEESLIKKPSIHTYWFLWNVIDTMLSPIESPALFMQAAKENFNHDKKTTILMYLNNFLYMVAGSVSHYNFGMQKISFVTVNTPYWSDPFFNSSEKYHEIKKELDSGLVLIKDHMIYNHAYKYNISAYLTFYSLESFIWTAIKILLALIIASGYLLTFKNKNAKVISLLLLLWLNHLVISAIFGEPLSRYVIQIMPITLLLGAAIFFEIMNYLKKEDTIGNEMDLPTLQKGLAWD